MPSLARNRRIGGLRRWSSACSPLEPRGRSCAPQGSYGPPTCRTLNLHWRHPLYRFSRCRSPITLCPARPGDIERKSRPRTKAVSIFRYMTSPRTSRIARKSEVRRIRWSTRRRRNEAGREKRHCRPRKDLLRAPRYPGVIKRQHPHRDATIAGLRKTLLEQVRHRRSPCGRHVERSVLS
jgi:hypothetical protein